MSAATGSRCQAGILVDLRCGAAVEVLAHCVGGEVSCGEFQLLASLF
jgi:hypothetical protein